MWYLCNYIVCLCVVSWMFFFFKWKGGVHTYIYISMHVHRMNKYFNTLFWFQVKLHAVFLLSCWRNPLFAVSSSLTDKCKHSAVLNEGKTVQFTDNSHPLSQTWRQTPLVRIYVNICTYTYIQSVLLFCYLLHLQILVLARCNAFVTNAEHSSHRF